TKQSMAAKNSALNSATTEDSHSLHQPTFTSMKNFSLPAKPANEPRHDAREERAGTNDGRAGAFAFGNITRRGFFEELVELGLRHFEQLRTIQSLEKILSFAEAVAGYFGYCNAKSTSRFWA